MSFNMPPTLVARHRRRDGGTEVAIELLGQAMGEISVPLSVLDLAPVGEGSSARRALASSLELVQEAERLGYHRHWVAEHHNMPGIASSSPPVLLAHLAAATSTIRLGSGGVMLPNHSPLVVAEQFGMLEALHPGRIDLGVGRAPGTDPLTAGAVRRTPTLRGADDFPEQFAELRAFLDGSFPEGHPYAAITAVPGPGYRPDLWLLGSSDFSAQLAGLLGLPFSFAHHFAARNTAPAVEAYRARFRPSETLEQPYLMLGVSVLCADTEERARWLGGPAKLAFVRLRSGRPGRYPTPEQAADYHFTPSEQQLVKNWTKTHVVGSPETVRTQLADLVDQTGADELMVLTLTHDPADRLRSYQLLSELARDRGPTTATSSAAG
jgi:luciferase family oxidoreductase group 1